MISKGCLAEAMYEAVRLAATRMPPDVDRALRGALAGEREPVARAHLESCLENARLAAAGDGLVCGDTGFPLFFVKVGGRAEIEGGIPSLREAAAAATARATEESFLRPTMVDPLSRRNPGSNVGPGMPKLEVRFEGEGDGLEVVAAPKGGGSEIFGTFYRMLYPSDGLVGVKKFVLECIRDSCYAGKICPPAIVGVGIGGTADLCMKLAKEASVLRPVGGGNPDPQLAELEKALLDASRSLGIGPMGSRGIHALLAVHAAKAATHTAALPVAFNAQCLVGRRWRACIDGRGRATFHGDPGNWEERS